jgi:lipoprotein-anchoring transpeptidase ErfK/SrfK
MRCEWTRIAPYALLAVLSAGSARAQIYPQPIIVAAQPQARGLGGGFIEFLFGERERTVAPSPYALPPQQSGPAIYANTQPSDPMLELQRPDLPMDPQFLPREVIYQGKEPPGTIVVDTPNHLLYLVEEGGRARRYGIGVGRPGFTWSGEHKVTAKKEWPDWIPPEEMLQRQPNLPRYMPGGPTNPLGARALYLGSTLYRIHGSNEPWTIGHNVSSGCIRMRNADVIDLYERVRVGARVIVL